VNPIRWILIATAVAAVPAALLARNEAQSAASSGLCWQSLTPEADPAGAIAESSLAATESGDVWLSRRWFGPNLLKLSGGKWAQPPAPIRTGVDELWAEAVATSPSGRVVIVAAANRDDGSSELHVGRGTTVGWEWLGTPLISARVPFTHAQRPGIAFVGERPVVAWSEELHAQLNGLFVAMWSGTSWARLGSLKPEGEGSILTLALAVDRNQQVWLAWIQDFRGLRVARWDGLKWLDVGRESLDKIVATQGATASRDISLAIDAKGRVWVLRQGRKTTPGSMLALTRWDGTAWSEVPVPRGPQGKDSTVWSSSMILRNDAPIIAWSQADATDNHHLYVSEWAGSDRWTVLLSGLHLVQGVSNVMDVRLAAGGRQNLFVSWDEPGKDQRSTRVVQAYPCKAGETPASPPTSTVERDTWPTTVDQAARGIVAQLGDESKARVGATKKNELIQYHHGWGMGIRNSLGLWRGNDKLLESCGGGTKVHPDSCSMVIIEAVWTLLQAQK
jgi:hypothetical protein